MSAIPAGLTTLVDASLDPGVLSFPPYGDDRRQLHRRGSRKPIPRIMIGKTARRSARAYFDRRLIVIHLGHPTCRFTGKQWLARELPYDGDAPKSPFPPMGSAGAIGRHNNTPKSVACGAGTNGTRILHLRALFSVHVLLPKGESHASSFRGKTGLLGRSRWSNCSRDRRIPLGRLDDQPRRRQACG